MGHIAIVSVVLLCACIILAGVAWLRGRSLGERIAVGFGSFVVYGAVLVTRPDSLVLGDASILLVAIGLAPLLGWSLGSAGAITVFAITASAVDVLSFGGGLTREIIQGYEAGTSDLLGFLAVTVRMAGEVRPLVGVVDLLLMGGLFLGLMRVHGRQFRGAVALLVGLASAVVTGLVIGGVAAIPFVGFTAAADAVMAKRGLEVSGRPEPGA